MGTASPSRLDGIQAARAIAALGVALYHSNQVVRWLPADFHFEPFSYELGINGVYLFFVISGFIIAKVVDGDGFELRGFAIKRFVRIFPLYWAVMLVAVVMESHGITFGQHGLDARYIAESSLILPMAPPKVPFFSLGWTLEHEIVFYAVAAFAGLAGGVRLLLAAVLMLGLAGAVLQVQASATQAEVPWLWHVVDWHNLYFAAGVGLYLARRPLARCGVLLPLVFCCASFWISMSWRYSGPLGVQFAVAVGGIALWAAALCVALTNLENRRLQGVTGAAWRGLVAVGNWSYSLYLVHYLLMRPVELAVKANLDRLPAWSAEPIRWGLIAASLALAWLLFRLVETPLIALGHRLARRPMPGSAPVGVS